MKLLKKEKPLIYFLNRHFYGTHHGRKRVLNTLRKIKLFVIIPQVEAFNQWKKKCGATLRLIIPTKMAAKFFK